MPDVPTPAEVGLPYEDVTLTTPDKLNIKAYVIPARRTYIPTPQLQAMSPAERVEACKRETESWAEEMGTEEAVKVSGATRQAKWRSEVEEAELIGSLQSPDLR